MSIAPAKLEDLQQHLGYHFGNTQVLLQALTHTSYGHENLGHEAPGKKDNERLEFLGDALLDAIISDILLEMYPSANEGQLSKIRAATVNERVLHAVTQSLHLSQFVLLGRGERQSGGAEKASILSGTLEAVYAAIYLDGGFSTLARVIREHFKPLIQIGSNTTPIFQDFKTQLQELCQAQTKKAPTYLLVEASGPDHAKVFSVEVRLWESALAEAVGNSKKEAEQAAAQAALELLANHESIAKYFETSTRDPSSPRKLGVSTK